MSEHRDIRSRHVARVVHAPPEAVYAIAADPDALPRWAAGLASGGVRREGDAFVVDSPMGEVVVRFVEHNTFGVLDHDVTLPDGAVVTNPLRVLPHPDGAEVVFSVRQIGLTDEEFDRDVAAVEGDIERLARLVERGRGARGA